MPDISKLSELAEIFNVTIDELLDNEKHTKIINLINDGKTIDLNELNEDELKDITLLVNPSQFKKSFVNFDGLS